MSRTGSGLRPSSAGSVINTPPSRNDRTPDSGQYLEWNAGPTPTRCSTRPRSTFQRQRS